MHKFLASTAIAAALMLYGCSTTSSPNSYLGTSEWQTWVEEQVHTGDDQGHGPNVGSPEWCDVVEAKLFPQGSHLKPCTPEWNRHVQQNLDKGVGKVNNAID